MSEGRKRDTQSELSLKNCANPSYTIAQIFQNIQNPKKTAPPINLDLRGSTIISFSIIIKLDYQENYYDYTHNFLENYHFK